MSSLTPEFFSALVVAVIIVGLALAVVRLYADFTRPLPPGDPAAVALRGEHGRDTADQDNSG